jgi:hypothetical protein
MTWHCIASEYGVNIFYENPL